MGKTIINVAITMTDDEWDRFDKRSENPITTALHLVEDAINDALVNDFGIISHTKVTKIE